MPILCVFQCSIDMILDIILGLIILVSAIYGYKRGFIKSIWGLAAWSITIAAVYAAINPTVEILNGTKLAANISNSVYAAVSDKLTDNSNLSLSQLTGLPQWAVGGILFGGENAARSAADKITAVVIKIIAAVGLFVIIRLILGLLFAIIDAVFHLPLLKGANGLLGAALSVVGAMIIVYIAAAVLALLANPSIYEYIEKTYIVKSIFDNNILMKLFIK